MNLAIDIGNTLTKLALFDNGLLKELQTIKGLTSDNLDVFIEHKPIEHSILSAVNSVDSSIESLLKQRFSYLRLSHSTPLPFVNTYETPATLGHDRLAAVAGAVALYPKTSLLVIDAGTCITFDYVNANMEYHGGSISPGIQMRLKALHQFTHGLPLAEYREIDFLTGNTTVKSILSGVVNGALAEVEGIINRYEAFSPGVKVLITGGDAQLFESKLKKRIFAIPNLVLIGLEKILLHNVKQSN